MKKMTSKQWLFAFFVIEILAFLFVMAFNYFTDPYGAFGDPVWKLWSYDETLNPRIAKISYLEEHHEEYDSYIVGPSSSSSWSTETLNRYLDAKFYNMIMYGTDMEAIERTCNYLMEHYTVKNLVVSIYISAAQSKQPSNESTDLHYKVDGSSPLAFYTKYLLNDPHLGFQKLVNYHNDGYIQQSYRVFDVETGCYDKSRRDIEPIGDLDDYLSREEYAVFKNYPTYSFELDTIEDCMTRIGRIKAACEERGIRLFVVCPPLYSEHVAYYTQQQQADFRNALAQVTDYWDFTLSSVSYEPRYFYDSTHFRNCVGDMALAKMFDDKSVYCPSDLGNHILQGEQPGAYSAAPASDYTTQIPILIYHNIDENTAPGTVSPKAFESQMKSLHDAGYHTVAFEDLLAYTTKGTELPDHPVLITFDDGYESNYKYAFPVLQKYGMKATVFAIGVSIGKDTYKDTGVAMTPHFGLDEIKEMEGVISVQSHGYNFHEVEGRDLDPIRKGVLQKDSETEEEYIAFLREDCQNMRDALGYAPTVLAYPYGDYSQLSELILSEEGIYATLTIKSKINTIVKGLPQSLRQLGRLDVEEDTDVLELIRSAKP